MNNFNLKKYAIKYLSKYSSSKSNLNKILKNKIRRLNIEKKEKFFLYNNVDNILNEFESKKIIDDDQYCLSKVQNFSIQGKSKIFVKNYLLQKGIEKNLIDSVLNNFEEKNPEWEKQSAKIFIRKKRLGLESKQNKEKDLAKMARAGFDYNIIKKTLGID